MAESLISAGADVNVSDSSGATPLIYTAQTGQVDVVKLLIAAKANLNASDVEGYTALLIAIRNNHREAAKLLVQGGAHLDQWGGAEGDTPLMLASLQGEADIVLDLVKAGADVNAKGRDGSTSLMAAAQEYQTGIAKYLLDKNALVNLSDHAGNTALHHAAAYTAWVSMGDMADLLIGNGANVNVTNNNGATPLMLASEFGHTGMVRSLLAHGANVHLKANDGQTALSWASGADEIARMLRGAGATE
jgi:ankyrin repeat protein